MLSLSASLRRLHYSRLVFFRPLSSTHSGSDIFSFVDKVSTLEKANNWAEISRALSSAQNKDEIVQQSCVMCSKLVSQSPQHNKKLWLTHSSSLPPCTFESLITASINEKNLDQLTLLLSGAKFHPHVASSIGVDGLFKFYSNFIETDDTSPALSSEIDTRIVGHFFEWITHMTKEASRVQSQGLFTNMDHLYAGDSHRMALFVEKIAQGKAFSKSARSLHDHLASIDSSRAGPFCFATYDFLVAHDINMATVFLNKAKERGYLSPASLANSHYSDLVWKSIPLAWSPSAAATSSKKSSHPKRHSLKREKNTQQHNFSPESVEVDSALADYLNRKVGGDVTEEPLSMSSESEAKLQFIKTSLDNLFFLAEGATQGDMKLRHTFYKNLLNCNRPRTLLSYEARRRNLERQYYSASTSRLQGEEGRGGAFPLDVEGYKCVLKAYAVQLDVGGMFRTLREWAETSHLVSTAAAGTPCAPFVTPDSGVYKSFIAFFHLHPQLVTAKSLERLFEQMQLDNVTPEDNKDIISLFKFANQSHAEPIMNTLLSWVEGMAVDGDSSTDGLLPFHQTASSSDVINKSVVSRKAFSTAELVQIYDFALETNSMKLNNGDKCLEILFTMKNSGISLNANRVALVMKALKNSKNFDAVLELFHSMAAMGIKRNTYHVSLAVVAYLRTDQVARGLALLKRFEDAGQDLTNVAYFAAAFEILRRLCLKPFAPFQLGDEDVSGVDAREQHRATVMKCVDLFVRAIVTEDMYAGSKKHLSVSLRLLDPVVYEDMISYLEQLAAAAPLPELIKGEHVQPPATHRLLQLFKDLHVANHS